MNVLVVAPHSDDAEVMCGGTVIRHIKNGDKVTFLILCSDYLNAPSALRLAEAKESVRRLGVNDLVFGGLKDGNVTDCSNTVSLIDDCIEKSKATLIYTTSNKDRHQDHRNTCKAVESAARRDVDVLSCELPSVSQFFFPTLFVDISMSIKDKMHAIEAHTSQNNGHSLILPVIETMARFRGTQVYTEYAEAFEPIHYLIRRL
ncbi:MAG: PIG-L family deacetylase [Candidatus Bathyarchaeota archaeon]|nr:PIG-L family deacetylase [Candidatus Bathyarchaeota archaeon]